MKARVNGWRIQADVTRDLASNPHCVEVRFGLAQGLDARLAFDLDMPAVEAVTFAAFLDELQHAVARAADADSCDRCGMPCDPGEAYCPEHEDTGRIA